MKLEPIEHKIYYGLNTVTMWSMEHYMVIYIHVSTFQL